ncbi:MAG: glycine--tRNA ligase [Oligoflexales bacterium]
MEKIVSLCKRRGFVFQSSEIYGGLKSCYDYGPLGVEMKRNIAAEWWRCMVLDRDDIVGLDASIIMHPNVWKASGHLANFADPLVDCLDCQERFRGDKAPRAEVGSTVEYHLFRKGKKKDLTTGVVSTCGYVCPNCGSPKLSDERMFKGMFQTFLGPVDPLAGIAKDLAGKNLTEEEIKDAFQAAVEQHAVYLRPETAQAMFVQFLNIVNTTSAKVPFGIAQQGKSFRNEVVVEHFIFRSCEFEQMEMEFFCEPGTQKEWLNFWTTERMNWYKNYSNHPEQFRLREHDDDELAHYSDCCYDVEYHYPWGWDELEGIASRTDYDLKKHAAASGAKISYFDPNGTNPETGKKGWRYTPYVVEPAAGLTRAFLCFLLDAYCEEEIGEGDKKRTRVVLKLDPRIAPFKTAVLPLVKKEGQPEFAKKIAKLLRENHITSRYDDNQSIGKRYARHDEIGTPFAIAIDNESIENGTVTIRDRDTMEQVRIHESELVNHIQNRLKEHN